MIYLGMIKIYMTNDKHSSAYYDNSGNEHIIFLGKKRTSATFNHEAAHIRRNMEGSSPDLNLWWIIPYDEKIFWEEVECWKEAVVNLPFEEKEAVMEDIKRCLTAYAEVTTFKE